MAMVLKRGGKSENRSSVARTLASSALFLCALGVFLSWSITESIAGPVFYSTSDPQNHWYVSTTVNNSGDGQFASFKTDNFIQAVNITSVTGRGEWIANNIAGTNGSIGNWTFFVFRQTFDLTGYDPTTAKLQFQWAADDIPTIGIGDRGTWMPKFSLNSLNQADLQGGTVWYDYGTTVITVDSGFKSGENNIYFFVEGNGVTDGFSLKLFSFTATPIGTTGVPEPATLLLLGFGIAGLASARRFRK